MENAKLQFSKKHQIEEGKNLWLKGKKLKQKQKQKENQA